MFLSKITLANFKSYGEAEFEFCQKVNCFVGNNGSGKTNLIDAIHYLSFSKSYFNNADSQNISHNADFFAIHGKYIKDDTSFQVHCIQKKGSRKTLKLDQKEYERLSEHIGKIPLIMIAPQDQELIYGSGENRRRFLDSVISQFSHDYLENLIAYNHILGQRNHLLKQGLLDSALFEVLDSQLDEKASILYSERASFIDALLPYFLHYFEEISQGKEQAEIIYKSSFSQYSSLKEALAANFEKDRLLQYTSVGIHRDDISFLLESYSLKKNGSQGQQKSFLLSLRLAQWEYMVEQKKLQPILLLDDVFDKLDKERVYKLIKVVGEDHFGQVFISDTDPERVSKIFELHPIEHKLFHLPLDVE